MNEIKLFFKTYFKEICFLLGLTGMVLCLIDTADAQTVNGSVYSTVGLISLVFVFCGGTLILGASATTFRKILQLNMLHAVSLIAVLGVLMVYSYFLQHTFAPSEVIKLSICWFICSLTCGCYMDERVKKLKKDE